MTEYEPENLDSEDSTELLYKIEESFDIKFGPTELENVLTFGELCDHITNKIQLDNTADCTTQQAFYKLRNSMFTILQADNKSITPETLLIDILPRNGRFSNTKKLENHLGFKISILRPPYFVTVFFVIILISSFIELVFNWRIGLVGLLFSIGGLRFSDKFGKELNFETVGQVAEKMTQENYLKSRRNPKTINKSEIEKVLSDLFSKAMGIDKSKLKRESKFV